MATNTFQSGGVDLKWSTTGNWDLGHIPIAGEDVVIPTGLTAVLDVTAVPASGTTPVASITTAGSGTITLALNTVGTTVMYVTTLTNGGTDHLLTVSGTTSNTFTLHTTTITGGGTGGKGVLNLTTSGASTINLGGNVTTTVGYGIYSAGGAVTLTATGAAGAANLTGGSSTDASAWRHHAASAAIIDLNYGVITGGGATNTCGFTNTSGSTNISISRATLKGGTVYNAPGVNVSANSTVTLSDVYFDNTGTCMAYQGRTPSTFSPVAANTMKWVAADTTKNFAQVVTAANLKKDVVNGNVTGTLATGYGLMP